MLTNLVRSAHYKYNASKQSTTTIHTKHTYKYKEIIHPKKTERKHIRPWFVVPLNPRTCSYSISDFHSLSPSVTLSLEVVAQPSFANAVTVSHILVDVQEEARGILLSGWKERTEGERWKVDTAVLAARWKIFLSLSFPSVVVVAAPELMLVARWTESEVAEAEVQMDVTPPTLRGKKDRN